MMSGGKGLKTWADLKKNAKRHTDFCKNQVSTPNTPQNEFKHVLRNEKKNRMFWHIFTIFFMNGRIRASQGWPAKVSPGRILFVDLLVGFFFRFLIFLLLFSFYRISKKHSAFNAAQWTNGCIVFHNSKMFRCSKDTSPV